MAPVIIISDSGKGTISGGDSYAIAAADACSNFPSLGEACVSSRWWTTPLLPQLG